MCPIKLPPPGISEFNGDKVFMIDGIPTVIKTMSGNFAKGYTIEGDLTTKPCVVAKGNGYFAHGISVHDATTALQAKIIANMSVDDKIEEFKKTFSLGKKYPTKDFYNWHNTLTGSCQYGRDAFAKNNHVNLDGQMTPEEFFVLVKDAFGWDNIKRVADAMGFTIP